MGYYQASNERRGCSLLHKMFKFVVNSIACFPKFCAPDHIGLPPPEPDSDEDDQPLLTKLQSLQQSMPPAAAPAASHGVRSASSVSSGSGDESSDDDDDDESSGTSSDASSSDDEDEGGQHGGEARHAGGAHAENGEGVRVRRKRKHLASAGSGSGSGSDGGGDRKRRKRRNLFQRVRSSERCGTCRTCLNPQLKKACETIRAQQARQLERAAKKEARKAARAAAAGSTSDTGNKPDPAAADRTPTTASPAPASTPSTHTHTPAPATTPAPAPAATASARTMVSSSTRSSAAPPNPNVLQETLARILAPRGGITDPKFVPAFESLLSSQAELGPRQVLLTVLAMSADAVRMAIVKGSGIKALEAWVVEAADPSCGRDIGARTTLISEVADSLSTLPVDVEALKRTGIGRTFGKLGKSSELPTAAAKCKALVEQWKRLAAPVATANGVSSSAAPGGAPGTAAGVGKQGRVEGSIEGPAAKKARVGFGGSGAQGAGPSAGSAGQEHAAAANGGLPGLKVVMDDELELEPSDSVDLPGSKPPASTNRKPAAAGAVQTAANGSSSAAPDAAGSTGDAAVPWAAAGAPDSAAAQTSGAVQPSPGGSTGPAGTSGSTCSTVGDSGTKQEQEGADGAGPSTAGSTGTPSAAAAAAAAPTTATVTQPTPVPLTRLPGARPGLQLSLGLGRLGSSGGAGAPGAAPSSTRLGSLRDGTSVTRLRGTHTGARGGDAGTSAAAAAISSSEMRAAAMFGGLTGAGAGDLDSALMAPVVSLPSAAGSGGRGLMSAAERATLAAARAESPAPGMAGAEGAGGRPRKEKRKKVAWPDSDDKLESVRYFRKVGLVGGSVRYWCGKCAVLLEGVLMVWRVEEERGVCWAFVLSLVFSGYQLSEGPCGGWHM